MGLFWSRTPVVGDEARGYEGKSRDPLTATLIAEGENGEVSISHAIRRVYVGPGAQQDSWPRMLAFLRSALAQK